MFSQGFDRDAAERKRDAATQQPRLLDLGEVAPGMVVGEVGAGAGYLTFHLAARVGPAGRVYANDILEQAVEVIRSRAAKKGLANVEAVLGAKDDPLFPANGLDRVFFLESFHEIRPPDAFLARLVSYLKPSAKVVICELESDGAPLLDGEHRYTRQEMLDIVARSPFQIDIIDKGFPLLGAPGHHPIAYVLSLRRESAPSGDPRLDAWRSEILAIHQKTIEAHWKKDARFFAENMADGYFALVWAWITLYERQDGRWVWLGESSSFKRASPTSEERRD